MITIWCPGIPVAQGSLKTFWRPGMKYPKLTSTAGGLKGWRDAMVSARQAKMGEQGVSILRGPVSVALVFYLIKPKSAPKKKIIFPIKRPDLDKYIRAAFDAMTGTLVIDDSQVVQVHASKTWEVKGPGVEITIMEMPA